MQPHIVMQENFFYVDKDILEARARGEADLLEVPHTCLTIGREIGKGAFGRVYIARADNINGIQGSQVVAVKKLKSKLCEFRCINEVFYDMRLVIVFQNVHRLTNWKNSWVKSQRWKRFQSIQMSFHCSDVAQYGNRCSWSWSTLATVTWYGFITIFLHLFIIMKPKISFRLWFPFQASIFTSSASETWSTEHCC